LPDTAGAILSDLLELGPEFARTWADDANLWIDEASGTLTACVVFTVFSHYIADLLRACFAMEIATPVGNDFATLSG
jgi:hypothetical protein